MEHFIKIYFQKFSFESFVTAIIFRKLMEIVFVVYIAQDINKGKNTKQLQFFQK